MTNWSNPPAQVPASHVPAVSQAGARSSRRWGSPSFMEVEHCQRAKEGQLVSGDVFLSQKIREEDRVIAVLSDGLGSGIKASVLANLTATMALKHTASFMDIRRSAETIMNTLPICSLRKISYSTFTIIDLQGTGEARIIEYDNPPFLLLRDGKEHPVESTEIALAAWHDRKLRYSRFRLGPEDRIVFFSDGITQAGMGEYRTPLGWGQRKVTEFLLRTIGVDRRVSAHRLVERLVAEAIRIDGGCAKDDTTAGVIYFRQPRQLMVITGPPFSPVRDTEVAQLAETFPGRKVICGGTTANIVARLLRRELRVDLSRFDPEIPPMGEMEGIDLITEGTLTLGRAASLLEHGKVEPGREPNAAERLVDILLDSDVIHFAVGTRINQAHQDPNTPVELDLRRNIVKKIGSLLERQFMKEVHYEYR